jgi:hypothetical protein
MEPLTIKGSDKVTTKVDNKHIVMEQLQRMMRGRGGMGGMGGPPAVDQPVPDTAEITHISSLALLKMLKVYHLYHITPFSHHSPIIFTYTNHCGMLYDGCIGWWQW